MFYEINFLDPLSINLFCSTKTNSSTNEHISTNIGQCDFQCPNNDDFTDEDNQNALEISADLTYLQK